MIRQQINLNYKDFHGQSFEGDLNQYFQGVDRDSAFKIIDLINRSEAQYNSTNGLIQYLSKWFSVENSDKFNHIADVIEAHARRMPGCEITIFNPPSTLYFTEMLIKFLSEHTNQAELTSAAEINLLTAYLVINQLLARAEDGLAIVEQQYPEEAGHWLFLYKPFQYADLLNKNLLELFLTENAKAILLFNHISETEQTKQILDAFMARYQCSNWKTYLKAISGMAVTGLATPNNAGNSWVQIDSQLPYYQTCIKILDRISVDVDMAEFAADYLYLRNHPIHRTGPDKFLILSQRFFLEKIFRALYFELKEINNDLGIMSANQFRSIFYTSGYSEKKLFYSVLNTMFDGAPFRRNGSEMEDIDAQFGASDYFAYQHGNVYLFESKDILISKEVKDRLYIPEMRIEFRKKFYKDGSNDKAVLQLARNIKKILDHGYSKFGFTYEKFRFIYPVIVVHTESFNVLALNQILFKWFKEACAEVGIDKKDMYRVKPVVLIDISTLLYYKEHINKKHTNLNQLIDQYITKTHMPKKDNSYFYSAVEYGSKFLLPFNFYLEQAIKKIKRMRTPNYLIQIMKHSLLDS